MDRIRNWYADRLNWADVEPAAAQLVAADLALIANLLLGVVTLAYVLLTASQLGIARQKLALATEPVLRLLSKDGSTHIANLSAGFVWIQKLTLRQSHNSEHELPGPLYSAGLASGESTRIWGNMHMNYEIRKQFDELKGVTRTTSLIVEVDFYHAPSGGKLFKMTYTVDPKTGEQVARVRK